MNTNYKRAYQSTLPRTLEKQIMDSTVPKNEREWWAAREIERLRAEVAELRKDAERYRYLMEHLGDTAEDNPILHSIPDDAVPTVVVNPNPE